MAGDSEVLSMINGWLLDYVCFSAWQEFTTKGRIDISASRDFIQGILGNYASTTPNKTKQDTCKIRLIVLLCKLSDGQDYDTQYDEDQEDTTTVLESALIAFNKLLSSLTLDDQNKAGAESIADLIRLQAVLVCCRDNDFDSAEAVYKKLWRNKRHFTHKANIDAVLASKDPENKILKKHSYESFVGTVVSYLQPIVDSFKTPFLVTVAKQVLENKEKYIASSASSEDDNPCDGGPSTSNFSEITPAGSKKGKTDSSEEIRSRFFNSVGLTSGDSGQVVNMTSGDSGQVVNMAVDLTKYSKMVIKPEYFKLPGNRPTDGPLTQRLQQKLKNIREHMHPSREIRQDAYGNLTNTGDRTSPEKGKVIRKKPYRLDFDELENEELTPESKLRRLGSKPKIDRSLAPPRSPSASSVSSVASTKFRQPWTEDEVQRLKKGVEQFGVGRWADIREKFGLNSRTSVQLKDKWRILRAQQEVDVPLAGDSKFDKKPYSAKEEQCLWTGVHKYGRQWKTIRELYPDLTDRSTASLLAKYNTMFLRRDYYNELFRKLKSK